jgi:multicomponent Na+:H+ antiporter subunit G
MIELIPDIIGYILLAIGIGCSLIGSFGLIRFPDVYTRIHACTVVVVGGVILSIIGLGFVEGLTYFTLKSAIIVIIIFITNPVAAHAISRAAHRSGVKLWERSIVDELKEGETSGN